MSGWVSSNGWSGSLKSYFLTSIKMLLFTFWITRILFKRKFQLKSGVVLGGEKKIITRLKWNREAENSKTYFCAVSGRFRNENGDSAAIQLRVELKEKVNIGWEFLTLVCFVDARRGLGVGVETLVRSPGTPKSRRQRQKLRKMMTMSTRINLYLSQQFAAVPCLVWR